MAGVSIDFRFESDAGGGYVGVLENSALVSGTVATQNAGSSDLGIYYQVGGGGLNGLFATLLGGSVPAVNALLSKAYDAKFGAGRFATDSHHPPTPPPLTSLRVPIDGMSGVGDRVAAMIYSVGPKLTVAGLTPSTLPEYTRIYADALSEIAAAVPKIDAFRVVLLSSGIYRGGAPLLPFAEAAAGAIISAVTAAVAASPEALGGLTVLVNAAPVKNVEVYGFTQAATALGLTVTSDGFTVPVNPSEHAATP